MVSSNISTWKNIHIVGLAPNGLIIGRQPGVILCWVITTSKEVYPVSIIHRSATAENSELRWQDVAVRAYGPANSGADRATRQILIGTEEGSPHFHLRYFAVQPGGYTSLDQHPHDHGIYILHGQARLRLGNEEYVINAGDVVYISGYEVHQLFTLGAEPLGFLCIVPANR